MSLILVFAAQAAAQACHDAIFAAECAYAATQGNAIVAVNGVNAIQSRNADGSAGTAYTVKWSDVDTSPEATPRYYILSPNSISSLAFLLKQVQSTCTGDEITLPAGWPNPAEFSASEFSNTQFPTGGT